MSGKRRKYTPEYREQAARLMIETGRPVAHVAAGIGVGERVLGRWVRLARERANDGETGAVLAGGSTACVSSRDASASVRVVGARVHRACPADRPRELFGPASDRSVCRAVTATHGKELLAGNETAQSE